MGYAKVAHIGYQTYTKCHLPFQSDCLFISSPPLHTYSYDTLHQTNIRGQGQGGRGLRLGVSYSLHLFHRREESGLGHAIAAPHRTRYYPYHLSARPKHPLFPSTHNIPSRTTSIIIEIEEEGEGAWDQDKGRILFPFTSSRERREEGMPYLPVQSHCLLVLIHTLHSCSLLTSPERK